MYTSYSYNISVTLHFQVMQSILSYYVLSLSSCLLWFIAIITAALGLAFLVLPVQSILSYSLLSFSSCLLWFVTFSTALLDLAFLD